jgi:transposase-like protein
MDIHKNARLTVHGRERIVRQVMSGQTPKAAALAVGVCPRTIRKWVARYRAEGLAGLRDRSSRPRRLRLPDTAGGCSKDRAAAPPTLDRQADRGGGRRLACHGQPRAAAAGLEQAECSGAGARPSL